MNAPRQSRMSRSKVSAAARRDELAGRVADGMTIRAAAKAMGVGESTALGYWAQIKAGLGAQAV